MDAQAISQSVVSEENKFSAKLDDCVLLGRVQQGDEQALALLYDRHSRVVYSVALRILRHPACAEDVLQDVFIQIWHSPQSFLEAGANLSGWLAVTSRNRSIDMLRRKKRRPSFPLEDCLLISPYNLANHAEQNLMCEKTQILIMKLPLTQRNALEMAFFQGMTHAEISTATGCSLGTIKSRIRSALSSLRKGFQPATANSQMKRTIPMKKSLSAA